MHAHRATLLALLTAVVVLQSAAVGSGAVAPPPGYDDPTQVYPDPVERPVRMKEQKPKPGDITTQAQALRRYTIETSPAPWASYRNRAGQFFIGSIKDGQTNFNAFKWSEDATDFAGHFYEVESGLSTCGWVLAQHLINVGNPGFTPCDGSWDLPPHMFSQFINCATCNGGWLVTLQTSATFYRNIRPWETPSYGGGPRPSSASYTRAAGYQVHWRYVSEDGNWVAVSDPNVSHLKWFFIRRSAIPNICGGGANAHPPADPLIADWGLVCQG